jgi:TatD DNase family protein
LGLIDSHAHLTSETLWPHIERIVEAAIQAKIERIINICTDELTLERGIELSHRHPWISNVAATTPHDVEKEGEQFFPIVAKAAQERNLIAIGETGLDYHYEHSPKDVQKKYLEKYFDLAKKLKLPVVIHCRDAFDDLFSIADNLYKDHPLLLHCFTGNVEEAKKALDRGWKISFSGILTFKKSETLRQAASFIPLTEILLETDSPYLAPNSKRGTINEPAYLLETAECLAQVKQLDLKTIIATTRQNTLTLFSLS